MFEFQTEEDVIALLEGLGYENPKINDETSILMTGWFNAYDAKGRHVYGAWRQTMTVPASVSGAVVQFRFIFEVWEMKE